jgi:hypothetical protein
VTLNLMIAILCVYFHDAHSLRKLRLRYLLDLRTRKVQCAFACSFREFTGPSVQLIQLKSSSELLGRVRSPKKFRPTGAMELWPTTHCGRRAPWRRLKSFLRLSRCVLPSPLALWFLWEDSCDGRRCDCSQS